MPLGSPTQADESPPEGRDHVTGAAHPRSTVPRIKAAVGANNCVPMLCPGPGDTNTARPRCPGRHPTQPWCLLLCVYYHNSTNIPLVRRKRGKSIASVALRDVYNKIRVTRKNPIYIKRRVPTYATALKGQFVSQRGVQTAGPAAAPHAQWPPRGALGLSTQHALTRLRPEPWCRL